MLVTNDSSHSKLTPGGVQLRVSRPVGPLAEGLAADKHAARLRLAKDEIQGDAVEVRLVSVADEYVFLGEARKESDKAGQHFVKMVSTLKAPRLGHGLQRHVLVAQPTLGKPARPASNHGLQTDKVGCVSASFLQASQGKRAAASPCRRLTSTGSTVITAN